MRIFFSLLMFGLTSNTYAELIKWVDANGHVHYGDQAPENTQTINIDRSTTSIVDSSDARRRITETNQQSLATQRLNQRELDRRQAANKVSDDHIQKCRALKKDIQTLNRRRPVYTEDKQGNRQFLNKQERQQEITKQSAAFETHCSGVMP